MFRSTSAFIGWRWGGRGRGDHWPLTTDHWPLTTDHCLNITSSLDVVTRVYDHCPASRPDSIVLARFTRLVSWRAALPVSWTDSIVLPRSTHLVSSRATWPFNTGTLTQTDVLYLDGKGGGVIICHRYVQHTSSLHSSQLYLGGSEGGVIICHPCVQHTSILHSLTSVSVKTSIQSTDHRALISASDFAPTLQNVMLVVAVRHIHACTLLHMHRSGSVFPNSGHPY